jgi:hypothetical protein
VSGEDPLKRLLTAALACAAAFIAAGCAMMRTPPAAPPTCPEEAGPMNAPIAVGWSRRWALSGAGAECYVLPIPMAGTWLITFGVEPPGLVSLEAVGVNGLVRQSADVHAMRTVTMTVPAAAGHLRVDVDTTATLTSVTVTLARPGTEPLEVVFSDDFRLDKLDKSKWKLEVGDHGWGNRELQTYTSSPANVSVGPAGLAINARREASGSYTSARLNSRFAAAYGRIEARIRTASGAGLLPAFWMLGADAPDHPWPACGEIDIMETLGAREPSVVHASIHGPDTSGRPWQQTAATTTPRPLAATFHTYTVDWWPNVIQMSVDGQAYASFTPSAGPWPFNKPFYLLLNVAVGGDWPGTPADDLPFPQTMQVDHVTWSR